MEVCQALSIDELFDLVRDYDLVLTVEAPLADSLNSRVEQAFLGDFATTPRRYVYTESKTDLMNKKELFHHIDNELEFGWKKTAYLLEEIIDCWLETGNPHKILNYNQYNRSEVKKILDILLTTRNIYRAMDRYRITGSSVAVVGFHQFKELDKKLLPDSFDKINVFKESKTTLPRFNVFNSGIEIVQALSKNVSKNNAGDTAFVLNQSSRYQPLVMSMLESKNIPYLTQRDINENIDFRNFHSLCRTATTQKRFKVGELQPLLKNLDIDINRQYNQKYIDSIESEKLQQILEKTKDSTIKEALNQYTQTIGRKLNQITEFYREAGLLDSVITEELLDLVEFYLDVFDINWETDNYGGVLFVSPKNIAWVDRPQIFHIGMNSEWSSKTPTKPWIDKNKYHQTKLKNFKILIQNQNSYYMVQNKHQNEEVTPCYYFNQIHDKEFTKFTDLPYRKYGEKPTQKLQAFNKKDLNIKPKQIDLISQSDLNKLVECPRNYYFNKLIPLSEQDYFKKGRLFHDYAEFYHNHPEYTDKNQQKFIKYMVSEMEPLVENQYLPILKTEFINGTQNIKKYIDENQVQETKPNGYTKNNYKDQNIFSTKTNKPITSGLTEVWFEDRELGCRGKIDLIKNKKQLVDYKSSKNKKTSSNIIKNSNIDILKNKPNFQAILYLMHHRKTQPKTEIDFIYYYFLNNIENQIQGKSNYKNNITKITYYPNTFQKQITQKTAYNWLCKTSKTRKRFLEKIGPENYQKAMEKITISKKAEYDKDLLTKECLDELKNNYSKFLEIGRGKDVTARQLEKRTNGLLRKLVDYRLNNYFKEDIDRFEIFLNKKLTELNKYKRSRFPVGEPDFDKLDYPDLIIK
ncbi:PD-(D/E)XK nuclease family protein [Methanonatronarchaeum sp. AMET-Sl]|uniref:PD-(D/E)XK nuclease family protein n=1 Tax=Methanonatronarchaeum sp. AMET-Sl TaxID=3037654 RepID=UPI00244E4FCE|nr:PD-(D/E)XK nuclease family protein [Methanonatronarchaeum sp. AMET-Sl]WGI18084.1 PD-(D/E)XK nuclease family protein [Methanonatronarchaeum sp. AMET-Sl]